MKTLNPFRTKAFGLKNRMKLKMVFLCVIVLHSCEYPMNTRKITGDFYYDCIFQDWICDIHHIANGITKHSIVAYSYNEKYILAKAVNGAYDSTLAQMNIQKIYDSSVVYFIIDVQQSTADYPKLYGPMEKDSMLQFLIKENQIDLVKKPYDYINTAYLKKRL